MLQTTAFYLHHLDLLAVDPFTCEEKKKSNMLIP